MKVYMETLAQPGFTEQLGATCAALLGQVAEVDGPASPFDVPDPFAPPDPLNGR